jgi:DNA polymerase-3 subunit alpha
MAFVGIEDFEGKAECIVFSDTYAKYQQLLEPDSMVMVTGKGETNGDALKILVNEVLPLEKAKEKVTKSIILSIDLKEAQESTIAELRSLMERNRGKCPCVFTVSDSQSRRMFRTTKYAVEPSGDFLSEARRILGTNGVRLVGSTNGTNGKHA